MPPSAITSASPSFATCTPTAPASTCRRAISGSLCVFVCGRSETPASRGYRRDPRDVRPHHLEVDHDLRRVLDELGEGGDALQLCGLCGDGVHGGLFLLTPVCPGVDPRTIRVFVAITPALRRIVSVTRLR